MGCGQSEFRGFLLVLGGVIEFAADTLAALGIRALVLCVFYTVPKTEASPPI